MYRKFFNYNKILYLLKHCKFTKTWMPHITTMYDTITASITAHMIDKHKPTIHWQLSLSQRAGGYGMRQPKYYYMASRIAAMTIPEERIEEMFNSECKDNTASDSDLPRQSTNITRTSAYQIAKQSHHGELQQQIHELNTFISPNKYHHHQSQPSQHRHLLKLLIIKYLNYTLKMPQGLIKQELIH